MFGFNLISLPNANGSEGGEGRYGVQLHVCHWGRSVLRSKGKSENQGPSLSTDQVYFKIK